jgi:hypothetical protein
LITLLESLHRTRLRFSRSRHYSISPTCSARLAMTFLYSPRDQDALPKRNLWHKLRYPLRSCRDILEYRFPRPPYTSHRNHIDPQTTTYQLSIRRKLKGSASWHTILSKKQVVPVSSISAMLILAAAYPSSAVKFP